MSPAFYPYCRWSFTTIDCGVQSGALKPVLVQVSEVSPTSPMTVATPVQPDGPSNDMSPEKEPVPVKPLMAPAHSGGSLAQLPSTQLIAV